MTQPTTNNLVWVSAALGALFSAGCSVIGVRNTPEPKYTVLEQEGDYEVRSYGTRVVAWTEVRGDYDDASNAGFRRLFKYITGENRSGSSIAMTAPVLQERSAGEGTSIPMTAPVIQEQRDGAWRMAFVLPDEYTLETAPVPTSPDVELSTLPSELVGVVTYSGTVNRQRMKYYAHGLEHWLRQRGYEKRSQIRSARYDPPFTIPMLRRNEIQYSVTRP